MSDFQLIEYDFETLKTEILTELQTNVKWANVSIDDTMVEYLIQILTYKEAFQLGVINNLGVDMFPQVSASDIGVLNFINFIGMEKNGIVSASGSVKFTLASVHTKTITIPAKTEISNGDIIFSTKNAVTLGIGQTEVEVDVIQGQWKTINNISDGTDFQKYYIYDDIDLDYVEILIGSDTTEWTKVSNFYTSKNTDKVYVVKPVNTGQYFLFSDDIFGIKPKILDNVEIKYLQSKGVDGNILSVGLVTTIISSITDSADVDVTNITVSNTEELKSGTDEDTMTDTKRNIPSFFITNPYISRTEDYIAYIKTNPIVRDVHVYPGWEYYPNDTSTFATIYAVIVLKSGTSLSTTQKDDIYDYVRLKDFFITDFKPIDAEYVGVYHDVNIRFKKDNLTSNTINRIKADIDAILLSFYDFETIVQTKDDDGNYLSVFRNIYLSQFASQISDIAEIKKVNLDLQSVEEVVNMTSSSSSTDQVLETGDGSTLVFSGTVSGISFLPSTFYFYYSIAGTTYTATVDDLGVVTGTHITSGLVTYLTGVWTLTFDTAPDNSIDITADFDRIVNPRTYSLKFDNLKSTETYLYIDDTIVGTYNASWNLVLATYYVGKLSSSIDFVNGTITITILDVNFLISTETDYVLSSTFYLRSNAVVDEDDIVTDNPDLVFTFYNSDISVEN